MPGDADRAARQEDHFLVEVIDPDTGQPVAPGGDGELVFTTLTKEALPLIRYRTGDIGRLIEEPCECGRTTVRLTGLRGRVDDMLIIRGVNLYPSQVEHALLSVDGRRRHYRLIVERPGAMDELTLECEPTRRPRSRVAAGARSGRCCARRSACGSRSPCSTRGRSRAARARRSGSSTGGRARLTVRVADRRSAAG